MELAKLDLNALNATMKDRCNRTRLHFYAKNAESEGNAEAEADWHPLLCFTLLQLTCALSQTSEAVLSRLRLWTAPKHREWFH